MPPILLFFLYLNTLYLTRCDAIDASVSKLHNADGNVTNDEDVTEIQVATCKITTEDLVARARATVTRVLTGACNAKTFGDKLQALEKNLTIELEEIKTLLYAVLEKDTSLLINKEQKLSKVSRKSLNYNDYRADDVEDGAPSPRQPEIDRFNNTVQEVSSVNDTSRFFFYYWRIKSFDEKLASWKTARSEHSSTFYIGQNGYAMYIKVTPRYFFDGTVFVTVGLTRGRHDSILKWPFPYKIRLEILDHSPEQLRQDRRSRVWNPSTQCSELFSSRPKLTGEPDDPECFGLSIPRQVFFSKLPYPMERSSRNTRYLWNGWSCDRKIGASIRAAIEAAEKYLSLMCFSGAVIISKSNTLIQACPRGCPHGLRKVAHPSHNQSTAGCSPGPEHYLARPALIY